MGGRDQPIAMISGGFDPLHIGHLDLIELASEYGLVMVALNSDAWLKKKKGYVFMPWEERARILKSIRKVTAVLQVDDADGTVCAALKHLRPDVFVNGGDRMEPDDDEQAVCNELGIIQIFGGKKIQSSSALIEAVR